MNQPEITIELQLKRRTTEDLQETLLLVRRFAHEAWDTKTSQLWKNRAEEIQAELNSRAN